MSDQNELVSDKIRVFRKEGVPQRQAVAESLSMARAGRLRPGGIYVRVGKRNSARKGSRR